MSLALLPRASPARHGVDPRAVAAFGDAATRSGLELHGLMLYHRGAVIAEGWWPPYRADLPHMQHSLAKSVTATAAGIALGEGRLALDDAVVSFFPDLPVADTVGDTLAAMTVRDLLTMRSGHRTGISGAAWRGLATDWAAAFLATPVPDRPGERFVYSSASSYMLSAILQRVTGERLRDYLEPRLFAPLGITGVDWDVSPAGVNPGGNGLNWPLEASLRLGILYAQDGVWAGRCILPPGWVRTATASAVFPAHAEDPASVRRLAERSPARGYGYHWWTWDDGAFLASGLFGQYAIVLPAQKAVIAVTAAVPARDDRLLDLIWRDLRPALSGTSSPAPTHGSADRLRTPALDPAVAGPVSPLAACLSGRCFVMEPNPLGVHAVTLLFEEHGGTFLLQDAIGTHAVAFGFAAAVESVTTMPGASLHHGYEPGRLRVLAHGGWVDVGHFSMVWRFPETAFRDEVNCHFEHDRITIGRCVNVNSGALAWEPLSGRAGGRLCAADPLPLSGCPDKHPNGR